MVSVVSTGQQSYQWPIPEDRGTTQIIPEEEGEPVLRRPTILEQHAELLCAHEFLRHLLEGTADQIVWSEEKSQDEYNRKMFGEEWYAANQKLKEEMHQQMRADGETSEEYCETYLLATTAGDLVFTAGEDGELVNDQDDMEPEELSEQFDRLAKRAANSWVERCGAAEGKAVGARAAVAAMLTFVGHPEVVRSAAAVIETMAHNHEKNRDAIAEMSVPMPPAERMLRDEDKGYTALRALLANLAAPIQVPANLKWTGGKVAEAPEVVAQLAAALNGLCAGKKAQEQLEKIGAGTSESPDGEAAKESLGPALEALQAALKKNKHQSIEDAIALVQKVAPEQKKKGWFG